MSKQILFEKQFITLQKYEVISLLKAYCKPLDESGQCHISFVVTVPSIGLRHILYSSMEGKQCNFKNPYVSESCNGVPLYLYS